MLHGSMSTIIAINTIVVVIVFLIASNLIFYRKYKSAIQESASIDRNESSLISADKENENKNLDIDSLAASLDTKDKRIENLEKFKTLYFKLDKKISSETKKINDVFVTLSQYAKKKSSPEALMSQAEISYQSLKSINPFLKTLQDEAFAITGISDSKGKHAENPEKIELIQKQRSIIKNLRIELQHSKSSLEKLKELERLQEDSSRTIKELKFKLSKEHSSSDHNQKTNSSTQRLNQRIMQLEKQADKDNEKILAYQREIESIKDESSLAPSVPPEVDTSDYIIQLTSQIAEKQNALVQAQSEYEKVESEYQKLFENIQSQPSSESTEELNRLKLELNEYEKKMQDKNQQVQKLERELAQSTSDCDDIINFQSQYETLKHEYKILEKKLNDKHSNNNNSYNDAKLKTALIENKHLKFIEEKSLLSR